MSSKINTEESLESVEQLLKKTEMPSTIHNNSEIVRLLLLHSIAKSLQTIAKIYSLKNNG